MNQELETPKVTITGKKEATIENYKGILKYDTEQICVNSSIGIIRINGKKLDIVSAADEELILHGIIKSVEY